MIIIFQDNKPIAVDKKLLKYLNTDLTSLNKIISPIEFNITALKNESIDIFSKKFNLTEISVLTIEDIKVFELSPQILSEETDYRESAKISTNDLFEKELAQNTEQIEPILPENTFENEIIEEKKEQNKEINISFNDEYEEINNILSLDKEKAEELIKEDLQQASMDLGIDTETLQSLFTILLDQIKENKEKFKEEIQEKDYDKLHRTAHLLKGAALNLRLSNIALILKTIDEESKKEVPIEKIEFLINQFYTFIDKIQNDENPKTEVSENKTNVTIPPTIKNLIIQTVQNYLNTQNDKKFKKDLKYINKLLDIKINSFEELENLIKADQ